MKFKNIFKKNGESKSDAKAKSLYVQLVSPAYQSVFKQYDLDEGMSIVEEVICQCWKPRYLLDHNSKRAYEFMTNHEILKMFTENDIDWDSLKDLHEEWVDRAHKLNAHYPTRICRFENGVAEVSWELNPDGRYYMDEDGYGITDDEEVTIYGFINRKGRVLVKFKFIDGNLDALHAMRKEAETIAND